MPEGLYEVRPYTRHRKRLYQPIARKIHIGETARFIRQPERTSGGYGFRVKNGCYGHVVRCVDYYDLLPVGDEEGFPLTRDLLEGGWHGFELPDGDPVEWCVDVDGYRRIYGDRSDFVAEENGHWVDVELRITVKRR